MKWTFTMVVICGILTLPSGAQKQDRDSQSQQLTVKVLDGRNGHPLKRETVAVWIGDHASGFPQYAKTGTDALAHFTLPHEAKSFVIAGLGVGDCREGNKAGINYIDRTVYDVASVISAGVVAANRCGSGNAKETPVPGVLTFYVRPLHWWEKMAE